MSPLPPKNTSSWLNFQASPKSLREGKDTFADLVDRNFELRRAVTEVGEADLAMVTAARAAGAAGKQCGSGGSIVAVPRSGVEPSDVEAALSEAGFRTCRPRFA